MSLIHLVLQTVDRRSAQGGDPEDGLSSWSAESGSPELAAPVLDGAALFSASAESVLSYLKSNTSILEWSVSRVAGGEQVHVHAGDGTFLHEGLGVDWDDTLCKRMLSGGARVVSDTMADPECADIAAAAGIRAYAGIPLVDDRGELFGTLCGVGADPLDGRVGLDEELLQLVGDLLSAQLAMARIADRERRAKELATIAGHTDDLTGLMNRRGWNLLVADAEQRVSTFGDPVAVAVIDLDGLKETNDVSGHAAGDDLLRRAAEVLEEATDRGDRVARYGGDEFTILSNNVAVRRLPAHFERFIHALERHGIAASVGYAPALVGDGGVARAFAEADALMYQAKALGRPAI